jgi:hypothetical protein
MMVITERLVVLICIRYSGKGRPDGLSAFRSIGMPHLPTLHVYLKTSGRNCISGNSLIQHKNLPDISVAIPGRYFYTF